MNNEILKKYNRRKNMKLMFVIIIDLIGLLSYLIPTLGEWGDAFWAPLSGFLIFLLFPNRKKMTYLGFIEEVMPLTDFIPTAYLTWRQEYIKNKDKTLVKFVKNEVGEQDLVDKVLDDINIDFERLSE